MTDARLLDFVTMLAKRSNRVPSGESQQQVHAKRLREIKRDAANLLDTLTNTPAPEVAEPVERCEFDYGGAKCQRERGHMGTCITSSPASLAHPPQPDALVEHWECFCDTAYYDMWCVRPVTGRAFGEGFHLVNHGEAERLCAILNRVADAPQPDELAQEFMRENEIAAHWDTAEIYTTFARWLVARLPIDSNVDHVPDVGNMIKADALVEENARLRASIEMALKCTPAIQHDGRALPKIVYDCGNPWRILSAALATKGEG